MVSNWLVTHAGANSDGWSALFSGTICKAWGMQEPLAGSTKTVQGVDYSADHLLAADMYSDAWAVQGCRLSRKVAGTSPSYDPAQQYPTTLIFAAGPNANPRAASSSCRRTYSARANTSYAFFKEGVAAAVRTSLASAALHKCNVVLLARFSGGLYAGPHEATLRREFPALVQGVLHEGVGPNGEVCGSYFLQVICVDLPAAAQKRAPPAQPSAGPSKRHK